jgi:MFS family permease
LWSGATALTGMARTFAVLFGMRLVLGVGESIAYPSYARILATRFGEHRLGFANAVVDAGTKLGPACGTLLGGLFMARYGWRPFFIVLGGGALLWLVPWIAWMPRGPSVARRAPSEDSPPVWEIFRHRSAIFSALGLFCSNYFWYFLVTWLPAYLETERKFPKPKMAVWASLAFLTVALSSTASGWLADRLIAAGGTPTRIRKLFAGVGLTLCTLILPVALIRDQTMAIALLLVTCACYGLFSPNLWAITQTLAGPRAAGKWTGVQNGVGNLAGVAGPWLTGWVVERTGQFYLAFVVAAAIVLTGAAIFVFGIGPIRQVEVRSRRAEALPAIKFS